MWNYVIQGVTFSLKKTRKDKVTVYWVSYLEGPQRVLLFTQDERIAYQARSNVDAEKSNLELFVSFSGIGVSLVSPAFDNILTVATTKSQYL
jgi:vacuolar protein sorting-associated protein 13A/C